MNTKQIKNSGQQCSYYPHNKYKPYPFILSCAFNIALENLVHHFVQAFMVPRQ